MNTICNDISQIIEALGLAVPEPGEYLVSANQKVLVALEYLRDLAAAGSTLAKTLPMGDVDVEDAITRYVTEVKRITEAVSSPQALPELPVRRSRLASEFLTQGMCPLLSKHRTEH